MMIRLLFTDIDGIFNSKASRRATRRAGILPAAVRLFDTFIATHDIRVVVTSDQRRYTTLDELCSILRTTERERFIGTTPIFAAPTTKSRDILQWLDDNRVIPHDVSLSVQGDHVQPALWAILDDRPLLYTHDDIERRLVIVNPNIGLQDTNLAHILAIYSLLATTL